MGKNKPKGSVMVVGAGIAGIQASLDLADSGYLVYLVEKKSAIGGVMAQLDKTFPTNDCSMCIISPKLVECGRHLNIELLTMTEVEEISGEPGNFKVKIVEKPRYMTSQNARPAASVPRSVPLISPISLMRAFANKRPPSNCIPRQCQAPLQSTKGGPPPAKPPVRHM